MDVLIPGLGDIGEVEVIEISVSLGDQVQENDGLIVMLSHVRQVDPTRMQVFSGYLLNSAKSHRGCFTKFTEVYALNLWQSLVDGRFNSIG